MFVDDISGFEQQHLVEKNKFLSVVENEEYHSSSFIQNDCTGDSRFSVRDYFVGDLRFFAWGWKHSGRVDRLSFLLNDLILMYPNLGKKETGIPSDVLSDQVLDMSLNLLGMTTLDLCWRKEFYQGVCNVWEINSVGELKCGKLHWGNNSNEIGFHRLRWGDFCCMLEKWSYFARGIRSNCWWENIQLGKMRKSGEKSQQVAWYYAIMIQLRNNPSAKLKDNWEIMSLPLGMLGNDPPC